MTRIIKVRNKDDIFYPSWKYISARNNISNVNSVVESQDNVYIMDCEIWENNREDFPNFCSFISSRNLNVRIHRFDGNASPYLNNYSDKTTLNLHLNSNSYLNFLILFQSSRIVYFDIRFRYYSLERICENILKYGFSNKEKARWSVWSFIGDKKKSVLEDTEKYFWVHDFNISFSDHDDLLRTEQNIGNP